MSQRRSENRIRPPAGRRWWTPAGAGAGADQRSKNITICHTRLKSRVPWQICQAPHVFKIHQSKQKPAKPIRLMDPSMAFQEVLAVLGMGQPIGLTQRGELTPSTCKAEEKCSHHTEWNGKYLKYVEIMEHVSDFDHGNAVSLASRSVANSGKMLMTMSACGRFSSTYYKLSRVGVKIRRFF